MTPHRHNPYRDLGDRTRRQVSTAGWDFLFVITILVLAVAGCRDPNAIERARQSGETAGRIDGQKTGYAEGYESAYEPAKDDAYKTTVSDLYRSNNYKRKRTYTVLVVGSALLLGFGLQYAVLYGLRRKEILFDIDRIVLPKRDTHVDLNSVLVTQRPDPVLRLKEPDL